MNIKKNNKNEKILQKPNERTIQELLCRMLKIYSEKNYF
jgi:hypothetical protein